MSSGRPGGVGYDQENNVFHGTTHLVVKLAMRAIQELGWKIDGVNEPLGLVNFQTNISWGSWSGVSCSLVISETDSNMITVTGTGKQNLRGSQLIALNIGGEAQSKASKAIARMQDLADFKVAPTPGSQHDQMNQLGVKQGNQVYSVGEYDFDTLGEALRFAKGQR